MQKLLGTIAELVKEVRDLREDFNSFRQTCRCWQSTGAAAAMVVDMPEMPLQTMEDLERLEVSLQAAEKKKALVNITKKNIHTLIHR